MAERVGFIGLGAMGQPMALHLFKAGHALSVFARRREAAQPLVEAGATFCRSPQEVAARSDVIFTMVTDSAAVEQVVLGEHGVVHGATPGSVVVDMGTISPDVERQVARALAARGIDALDAPVSGGPTGAINATLSIMVGGKPAVFERVRPLLERLGRKIVHVGDNGAGQVTKAANQIVTVVTIQAVAEALLFAQRAGVDPAKVREALLGGFAASPILELFGERMVRRDFRAGVEARLHHKDINIALDLAAELGLALPATAVTTQCFNALMGAGHGRRDSGIVLEVLERMAALRNVTP